MCMLYRGKNVRLFTRGRKKKTHEKMESKFVIRSKEKDKALDSAVPVVRMLPARQFPSAVS